MGTAGNVVMITGGGGFLGAHTAAAFAGRGWKTIIARRASSDISRVARVGPGQFIEHVDLDLLNQFSINSAVSRVKPDLLVHCAAYGVDYRQQDLAIAVQTNILATAHLVDAAINTNCGRFLHIGTSYEYGDYPRAITEETPLRPRGIYGTTKAGGTLIALDRAAGKIPLVVVRPFGMYGPAEGEHKFVPLVIKACTSGSPLSLTPGKQIRDYVFVGDVTRGLVDLAERQDFPAGEIFNFGSGSGITVKDFGNTIAQQAGSGSDALRWGERPNRSDEMMSIVADVSKAARVLGWKPNTSLAEGLAATIRSFRESK